MQKVLDFLELHVQWVAIAIAAVFLLYALSGYLPGLAQPVTATVNNQPLGPDEVDPQIAATADEVQAKIDTQVKVPMPVPDYVARLKESMSQGAKPVALPRTLTYARPVELPPNLPFDQSNPDSPTNNKVAELPTLPAAYLEPPPTTDFAQVVIAPAAAPGAPPAPPTPVPAAVPGAPAVIPNATDTTWVRVPFNVPAGNVGKAFGDVNMPANLSTTSFLRVDLIRQKQLPGGQWGPEEVVDILPTIQMPQLPPDGEQNMNAQQQYLSWATSNQQAIVQPEFPQVVAGSDPRMTKPIETDTSAGAAGVFDPETFPAAGMPGGDISTLTPEQQTQVRAVRKRRAMEAEAAKPKPTPGPGRGGGGGGRGGGGGGGGAGPGGGGGRFGSPATTTPPVSPTVPFQQGVVPPGDGMVPGMEGSVMPGQYPGQYPGQVPGAPTPTTPIVVTPLPQAPFDPNNVPGGLIQGWAYDTTAAADSTYRYRVRYKLKNPIFGVQNVASKPELITVFALAGEDPNVWTDPITIAPLTHIFLSNMPTAGSSRVGFTVFRWQSGKRHRLTNYFVGPGDSIGKEDGGIDYRTQWTLVEVRRDSSSNAAYALLMNADGMLKRLEFEADKNSALFKQLTAEVDGPPVAPPPPQGAPGNPGGYPGGGYPGGGYPAGGYPGGAP